MHEYRRKIYAIQHNVTKRIYVGMSKNVIARYKAHLHKLRSGKCHIEDMQNDFDLYGEDYSLFIIDDITDYKDRLKEYDWMIKYKSHIRGTGYNYKDVGFIKHTSVIPVPLKEGLPERKA